MASMTSDPLVTQAFTTASGVDISLAHDVFAVLLASLALVWLTWVIAGIGQKLLLGTIKPVPAMFYVGRATVLVMFVVYTLVQ